MAHVIDNLEFGRIPRPSIAHNIDKINELVDYVNENDDFIHNQPYQTVMGNDTITGNNALVNLNAKDFSIHGNTIVENDSLLSVDLDGIEIGNEVCEIPAATYFPNGMRGAGTAYDELTNDKAVTRIGSVDLGTFVWSWQSSWKAWFTDYVLPFNHPTSQTVKQNLKHATLDSLSYNECISGDEIILGVGAIWNNDVSPNSRIVVRNGSTTTQPTGILYYELATTTEVTITPSIETPIIPESQFTATVQKNNVVPVPFELTYYVDANTTIDDIIARIEALEQGNRSTLGTMPVTLEKQDIEPDIIEKDETKEV